MTAQLPENAAAQTTKSVPGDITLDTRCHVSRACIMMHAKTIIAEPRGKLPQESRFTRGIVASSGEPDLPTRCTPTQPEEWSRRTRAGRKEAGVRTRW